MRDVQACWSHSTHTEACRLKGSRLLHRGKEALIGIVTALCNLHGNSFAHLDLKTPNVLIASDGSVKVADVGLGKLVMGSQNIKLSHPGTFIWAAPEQLSLQGSFASDMFALSTIIHEVSLPYPPPPQGPACGKIAYPSDAEHCACWGSERHMYSWKCILASACGSCTLPWSYETASSLVWPPVGSHAVLS